MCVLDSLYFGKAIAWEIRMITGNKNGKSKDRAVTLGLGAGIAIGLAIGLAVGNLALGIGIGIAIGAAIASERARK